MNKFKSQILMLSLLAALLFITPLFSSSFRTTYLYFVMNLLIIALGVEAGLISVFSKPPEEYRKQSVSVAPKPVVATQEVSAQAKVCPPGSETKARVVEKSASEKIPGTVLEVNKVKKCPSTPSLFFIGSGETEAEHAAEMFEEEEEEVLVDDLSGQELFTKAEMFIGNFYKQLKMQREESWKRIHGFYQKGF